MYRIYSNKQIMKHVISQIMCLPITSLHMGNRTRQIRTPVLRIPPAVTSQAKMKNWLHECQKWVSHMIGQYAHI